jgi:hypothetical protein
MCAFDHMQTNNHLSGRGENARQLESRHIINVVVSAGEEEAYEMC